MSTYRPLKPKRSDGEKIEACLDTYNKGSDKLFLKIWSHNHIPTIFQPWCLVYGEFLTDHVRCHYASFTERYLTKERDDMNLEKSRPASHSDPKYMEGAGAMLEEAKTNFYERRLGYRRAKVPDDDEENLHQWHHSLRWRINSDGASVKGLSVFMVSFQ